jgi:hypothetical protein
VAKVHPVTLRPFSARHLASILTLILVAIGLVAAGVIWARVAQTISDAKPVVVATTPPSAIVWADRVFTSPEALKHWLWSRGATYAEWKRRYPAAASVIEHRRFAAPASASSHQSAPTAAADHGTAPAATPNTAHGRGYLRLSILGILVAVAVACALAAALPTALLVRFPALARAIVPHRELWLAGAAALTIGLLVGGILT